MKTLVALLALVALPALAQAQEPDPERIEAALPNVYEASVELDAELAVYPVVLNSIRNDEVAGIAEFAALALEDHTEWTEGAPEWSWNGYYQGVTVEVAFAGEGVLSLIRRTSYYTGGAHPNQSVDAVLTMTDVYNPVELSELLIDASAESPAMTALFYALYRELMAIKQERLGEVFDESMERETWLSSLAAEAEAFPTFSLMPNESGDAAAGLIFHFEPYEVGSYAEGGYDVPVPLGVFEAYLTESWQTIFSGGPSVTILTGPGDTREPQSLADADD